MPILKNPKHEKFAQMVARGSTLVKAYERAGYEPNTGNATNLRKRPEVAARIEEIEFERTQRIDESLDDFIDDQGIDAAYIIKQVLDNGVKAKEAGQFNAANKSFEMVGKELFGLFADKKETKVEHTHVNAAPTITVQDFTKLFDRITEQVEILDADFTPVNDRRESLPRPDAEGVQNE